MSLKIIRVTSIPEVRTGNTIYLLKNAENPALFDFYATNSDGTELLHVATQAETLSSALLYSPTPPPLPNPTKFWWNTADGSLNVQYEAGETVVWVEAMPSIPVPDFDGTGEANTMARSDHNHDTTYAKVGQHEW